ncbi:universal stress protein [Streptomyces sp. SAI-041]|uniref:universal stress protein n=1 Tax=Streptomyces sp. SAI-041 TaxID=2940548 RepID=UPI0024744AD6|nr:universal stress protein [Streptomyces sp. SAI-041]MDH6546995.1 nucleotide-binding universal stress UspA family protein [Streptomyces sp. SAI-041]
MTEHADGGDRIVVGVDGSEASRAALRWATEAARRLGAEVVAVHAWDPAPALAPYARVRDRAQQAAQRERAAEVLAAAVRETVGPRVDPAVRAVLVEGPAARVLLQQSRGALLLALGLSRPVQDGLRPAVSPVGRECLRGSPVPVVAVPVSERPVPALRAVGPYEVVV